MSLFSRGIVAAMEDEMANQELAIDEAGADSMEADLVEGVVLTNNIETGIDKINSSLDDVGQLGRHIELLVATESYKVIDPHVVETTLISVESIYERLGVKKEKTLSLESINQTKNYTDKIRQLRISCEGVLSTVWQAVVSAIKKVIEWIKNFFNWIFGTNNKVSARVEVLEKKQVEIVKSEKSVDNKEKQKDAKIDGTGISDVLLITNFSDYGKDEEHNVINTIVDSSKFIAEKKALVSSIQSLSDIEKNFHFKGGKGDKFSWPSSDGFSWYKIIDCTTFELAQLLPTSDKEGREAIKAAGKFRLKENRKKGKVVELPALTNDEITKALKIAKEITTEIDSNDSVNKESEKFLEDSLVTVNKIADRFKDILHGKAEGDFNKEIEAIKTAVTALVTESTKYAIIPLKDLNMRAVALTKYVERSQKV